MIGRTLGHYRILDRLGSGGMGEVYRAEDLTLGRTIALKVLPAEVAADPDRLERFEREARAVASLTHPHIVTLHSIEEAEGVRFLTLELVEGETLERRMAAGGLSIGEVLRHGAALASALDVAHRHGIVHRDLKPSNVIVGADGEATSPSPPSDCGPGCRRGSGASCAGCSPRSPVAATRRRPTWRSTSRRSDGRGPPAHAFHVGVSCSEPRRQPGWSCSSGVFLPYPTERDRRRAARSHHSLRPYAVSRN